MKRRNTVTDIVRCLVDGAKWGAYLTAGETYTARYPTQRGGDVTLTRTNSTTVGTMMRARQFIRGVELGYLEIVT